MRGKKGEFNIADTWFDWKIDLFIIAVIGYHFAGLFLAPNSILYRFTLSLIFFLVYVFVLMDDTERNNQTWRLAIAIFAIEVGAFYLALSDYILFSALTSIYIVKQIFTNSLIGAWWFFFAAFMRPVQRTFIRQALKFIYIVWLCFLILMVLFQTGVFAQVQDGISRSEQLDFAKDFYAKGWNGAKEMYKRTAAAIKQQSRLLSPDYYTGEVEQNQKEKLGVYLEDLKPAAKKFQIEEQKTIWALLKARTLHDGIGMDTLCYSGKLGEYGTTYGTIQPQHLTIYNNEQEDLDCTFSQYTLKEGTNKVTFSVAFNFETMAYWKTYFIDEERLRSMRRQNLDPLDEFNIDDKKPVAIYTNGPVKIGIGGRKEPPFAISKTNSENPLLGVTIDNNIGWEGKIKEINEVIIQVPDSMSINGEECSPAFEEINEKYCEDVYNDEQYVEFRQCKSDAGYDMDQNIPISVMATIQECVREKCKEQFEGYKQYKLVINNENRDAFKDIEEYKTFTCRLNIDDPEKALGTDVLTTKYFRARARYKYEIEKTVSVSVEKKTIGKDEWKDTKDTKEILSNIFIQHSHSKDTIKKAVAGKEIDECYLMSIIAAESRGNPRAISPTECKGIMQLCTEPATKYPSGDPLCTNNCLGKDQRISDPDKAILAGAEYLDDLYKKVKEKTKDDVLMFTALSYKGEAITNKLIEKEIVTWSDVQNKLDEELLKEVGGVYSPTGVFGSIKSRQQKINEIFQYVDRVISYNAQCKDLELATVAKLKEETEGEFIKESSLAIIEYDSATANWGNITLNVTHSEKNIIVSLHYGEEKLFANVIEIEEDWLWDEEYPFVRVKLVNESGKYILKYQYFTNSIVNTGRMFKTSYQYKTTDKYWIWKDYIYALNHGSTIGVYDSIDDKLCDIKWDDSTVLGRCVPGLVARYMDYHKADTVSEGYIKLQFEYNPGEIV